MERNYIEIESRWPFIIEYMYIDFLNPDTAFDQFEYHGVFGWLDKSMQLSNEGCPHLVVRVFKSFCWHRDQVEESFETLYRKINFKYPEELEFCRETYNKINKKLEELGL